MANFNEFSVSAGSIASSGAASFRQPARSQLIEISDQPVVVNVVREGNPVPVPKLNPARANFEIENLVTLVPRQLPRVVSQSIPPQTKVTRGTVINFVVVPRSDIPFNIFEGLHESFVGKPLNFADSLVDNQSVREVLLKNEAATDVTPAEKATLVTAFQSKGIVVDDTKPGQTFEKAFNNVRGAVAFR
jgi:hypothetical protein